MRRSTTPELALGTVQFGLDYGITNASGQVELDVVKQLLQQAAAAGVGYLDTAQAYGNSEQAIGAALPTPQAFRIVSKLSPQADIQPWDAAREQQWQQALEISLERLNVSHLDGFLLHSADDLRQPQAERLLDWLRSLQSGGLVKKIGVSIYQVADLEGLPLSDLQLVQLPCSLYDQRLITSGTVERLQSLGLSLHARSIYLQGLLVTPASAWPARVRTSFLQHHRKLEQWAKTHGCSLVDLALGWAKRQPWMDAAVVGITTPEELQALLEAWHAPDPWHAADLEGWAWPHPQDLDPRCWPKA